MDFQNIIPPLMKWVKLSATSKDKIGVSFIKSTLLNYPATFGVIDSMTPSEMMQLFYTMFFMNEGDDYQTAREKSQQLKYVQLWEVKSIDNEKTDCEECYGDGTIRCENCDGDQEEDCTQCDGEGTIEDSEGVEIECDVCDGRGKLPCDECWGDGDVTCEGCGGDGEIEDYEEYRVEYNEEMMVYYSPELFEYFKNFNNGDVIDNEEKIYDVIDTIARGDVMYLGYGQLDELRSKMAEDLNITENEIEDGYTYVWDYGILTPKYNFRLDTRSRGSYTIR